MRRTRIHREEDGVEKRMGWKNNRNSQTWKRFFIIKIDSTSTDNEQDSDIRNKVEQGWNTFIFLFNERLFIIELRVHSLLYRRDRGPSWMATWIKGEHVGWPYARSTTILSRFTIASSRSGRIKQRLSLLSRICHAISLCLTIIVIDRYFRIHVTSRTTGRNKRKLGNLRGSVDRRPSWKSRIGEKEFNSDTLPSLSR